MFDRTTTGAGNPGMYDAMLSTIPNLRISDYNTTLPIIITWKFRYNVYRQNVFINTPVTKELHQKMAAAKYRLKPEQGIEPEIDGTIVESTIDDYFNEDYHLNEMNYLNYSEMNIINSHQSNGYINSLYSFTKNCNTPLEIMQNILVYINEDGVSDDEKVDRRIEVSKYISSLKQMQVGRGNIKIKGLSYIFILGRNRKFNKVGNTKYIKYKNKIISITDARLIVSSARKNAKSKKIIIKNK